MIIPDTKKKLKDGEERNKLFIYFAIGCLVLLLFVFLQPKVSSYHFPQKRSVMLSAFLTKVSERQQIDPRSYWEFREFYSPGYFDFSATGLSDEKISEVTKNLSVLPDTKKVDRVFLTFHSKKLASIDLLTKESALGGVIAPDAYKTKEIVYQNKNTVIFRDGEDKLTMIFLKPLEEMKKANGFFDYRDVDKELVKDKNWVNVTTLSR